MVSKIVIIIKNLDALGAVLNDSLFVKLGNFLENIKIEAASKNNNPTIL